MIVTFSGLAGSGTTTISKTVSQETGIERLSAGEIFRKEAEKHGMSVEEFGEYAAKNPEIDKKIDCKQSNAAAKKDSLIVEGRLAGWKIDADLKIWLKASLKVRAERVAARESIKPGETREKIEERDRCNKKRYRQLYGIDLDDKSIYHLVIDTSKWSSKGVSAIVTTAIEELK